MSTQENLIRPRMIIPLPTRKRKVVMPPPIVRVGEIPVSDSLPVGGVRPEVLESLLSQVAPIKPSAIGIPATDTLPPTVPPIVGAPDVSRIPEEKLRSATTPLLNATPKNITPITETLDPSMIVTDIPQRSLTVPPITLSTGSESSRIRELNPPDELTRRRDAVTDRQNAPLEKIPRWKAALSLILRNLGHVADRPLAPGENVWARILGSMAGSGAAGLIQPKIESQIRHDTDVSRVEGEYQKAIAGQKAITDIDSDRALNEQRKAQTQKLLRPPQPIYRPNAQGQIVKIIPSQVEGVPDRTEIVDSTKKSIAPNVREIDGNLLIYNRETGRFDPALDTAGRPITSELKTPVDFEIGGKVYRVTPNTAAVASATGERFNISQAATESRFQRGEARADARTEASDARHTQADEKKNRANAQSLINQARGYRARAAAARTQEAADELLSLARQAEGQALDDYPEYVEQTPSISAGGMGVMEGGIRIKPAGRAATPTRSQGQPNYAGRSIKRANVAAWGRERGMSEADALKELERLQVKVY